MPALLLEVAPLALAIALSPFRILVAVLLLFTPRARAASGAFLGGWAAGIGAATGLVVVLATVVEGRGERATWGWWVRIVLGVILLLVAVRLWNSRREKAEPAWMRTVASATPVRALKLGGVLSSANPKALLLSMGGGVAIAAAELPASGTAVGVAAFTAIASTTVAIPLVLHALAGERILPPLGRAVDWLTAHNAGVVAVAFAVAGVVLLVTGVAGL